MSKFKLVLMVAAVAALAACDDEAYRNPVNDDLPPPAMTEPAPAAQDEGVDASATATQTPPMDYSQLPPPPESSEETVQPESETLFY
ncbi:MAG: hypothetical protein ACK4Y4_13175 [Brevundimonas sp.]